MTQAELFTFDSVFKDAVDEVGRDTRRSRHARTRVDLNQPRLEVFRQHEVSTIQFKRRLSQTWQNQNHVGDIEDHRAAEIRYIYTQMGDSLPLMLTNRRAKCDSASFIFSGEIHNRTNKQTKRKHKEIVTNISTPCLSACVDKKAQGIRFCCSSVNVVIV